MDFDAVIPSRSVSAQSAQIYLHVSPNKQVFLRKATTGSDDGSDATSATLVGQEPLFPSIEQHSLSVRCSVTLIQGSFAWSQIPWRHNQRAHQTSSTADVHGCTQKDVTLRGITSIWRFCFLSCFSKGLHLDCRSPESAPSHCRLIHSYKTSCNST